MPSRRGTGRPTSAQPTKKPKSARKQRKRAQNALAVAEVDDDDDSGIRKSRLGDSLPSSRKRQRENSVEASDEDKEGEDSGRGKRPNNGLRARYGEDAEYGSDGEGNEWVTGQVDDEDDESLDSDEAFGESDEERFEDFTFRGSKAHKSGSKSKSHSSRNILDEDNYGEIGHEELDSDAESENFAENAVDLYTMLDDDPDAKQPELEGDNKTGTNERYSAALQSARQPKTVDKFDDYEDSRSELSLSDEDDGDDDEAISNIRSQALLDMVSSLSNGDPSEMEARRERDNAQEKLAPTSLSLQSGGIKSLLEGLDPNLRKQMGAAVKPTKKSLGGVLGKVEVPLPQRQQQKIDRAVAFEKANETLNRWIDTVKLNRRAEHLSFPLVNRDEASAKNANRFKPIDMKKPRTDLEKAIQSILIENGSEKGSHEPEATEADNLDMEDLQETKNSLQNILAERAELRKARDLIFREEVKARRIKKIKSKAYRRVHRKARERELRKQQEIDASNGRLVSEDDQERLERLRAEERMGSKHRESKWAKAMKTTGRTAWDEDARNGLLDMARREEELKKRILGEPLHDSDYESGDDESSGTESEQDSKIEQSLFKLRDDHVTSDRGSRLANMAFMKRAEEAQRRQNDEVITEIRHHINGGDSSEEPEEGPARQRFGPQSIVPSRIGTKPSERSEFEAAENSDEDDQGPDFEPSSPVATENHLRNSKFSDMKAKHEGPSPNNKVLSRQQPGQTQGQDSSNDWNNLLEARLKTSRRKNSLPAESVADEIDPSASRTKDVSQAQLPEEKSNLPKAVRKQVRLLPPSENERDNDDAVDATSSSDGSDSEEPPPQISTQRLAVQRAFAGDEVTASFEEAKALAAADERSPSPSADILPGWGSWTGAGLTKRDRKDRQRREAHLQQAARDNWMSQHKGAKNGKKINQTRRDANLERVIISEKRMPKAAKYLAGALPRPFENRAQYERSIRVPVGPEWTTKESFQTATKPRILLGGGVIKPMEKPIT